MENSKIKNWIIIALVACLALLSTCEFIKTETAPGTINQDTLFLSQWKREKNEKLKLIASYEKQLDRLQIEKDSLQKLVNESKQSIVRFRNKAQLFQNQLKEAITKIIPKDSLHQDSITPIVDSLIVYQQYSDSACDLTIDRLESIVASRDTSISIQKEVEVELRDLNKEAELRTQYLTEQLNTAYKAQRKKIRQNKLLAGGLLILSGITTSLLLTHSIK